MFRTPVVLVCLLGLFVGTTVTRAENWPRWRGPDGNAVSTESPLPLRWSKTENVRWKAVLPGEGTSSPIVWDDRVFVTAAVEGGKRRLVLCLDRRTGKILWQRELADKDPENTSAPTGHAAATPATDGKHIVASFGNAGVVCFDFTGKQLWHRSLGEFDTELGLASSPVIHGDRVFLVCDHDGDRFKSFDSFLIALDLPTGRPVWKAERRGLFRSWSTPLLVPTGERWELIVNGQDELRGYDPETGKQRWRLPGMTGWVTPSPVFGHGLIFTASGNNGPLVAIAPGGSGDVKATWRLDTAGPYVCSPLLYGDRLYVHNEKGILSCYAARTGKLEYKERLAGKFLASAAAGDGKIYLTNEAGVTFVVRSGPEFEVLERNDLEEYSSASPAISGGQLLLRTERHLYCIEVGKRKSE